MSISFVDYYQNNDIFPVHQDISDLQKHFSRRGNLFKTLGLAPNFMEGKSIAEFGPGLGHNSIYKASLSPKRYVLIEGNKTGLDQTLEMLKPYCDVDIDSHLCLFQDFFSDEKFDLIWAEGCIPHQQDPIGITKSIAKFVKLNGILVVTCISGLSYLSEIMRRIVFMRSIEGKGFSIPEKLARIRPMMKHHLSSLPNMSRYVDDWILDSIIQPFGDAQLFTIPTLVEALQDQFSVYKTSPDFIVDWRWYKDIFGHDAGYNQSCIENYYSSNVNLIDTRISGVRHSVEFGQDIEVLGEQIWVLMQRYENGDPSAFEELNDTLEKISSMTKSIAPSTSESIADALEQCKNIDIAPKDNAFSIWWGRGQQYVSLVKDAD